MTLEPILMKPKFPFGVCLCLALSASAPQARAANDSARLFDLPTIRDVSDLETTVIQDWKPNATDPAIRQKLIEITVCEWWPGQKVRLPVTLNIPAKGVPCRNILVANMPLRVKPATPRGEQLELLKKHGVGVVLIGMGTIDAMKPAGELHLGMKKWLLKTKDVRYTPAWIWGMSQMRALTAASAETDVFRPERVLTTGGSKRGVAAAVAGIHDDRFTAIMPVVAPPLGNPGGTMVIGTGARALGAADRLFFEELAAGQLGLDPGIKQALDDRSGRRAAQRVTLEQVKSAGWNDSEIQDLTGRCWDACRIVDFLPRLDSRGLDYFYVVGANDSVTPALLELGRRHPDFPIHIVPGGQHGGPATAGFTRRTPLMPEAKQNFLTFALHHFFGARDLVPPPQITHRWLPDGLTLRVEAIFPEGIEPGRNALWWSIDKSEPFTLFFEYDRWDSQAMERRESGRYAAELTFRIPPKRLDILTVHTHVENDLSFTVSSPYLRAR